MTLTSPHAWPARHVPGAGVSFAADASGASTNARSAAIVLVKVPASPTSALCTKPDRKRARGESLDPDAPLSEALERHGIDPGSIEIKTMYGKNSNLLGPRGEPWEEISGLTSEGDIEPFGHHANGHFFHDTNEFERPHYHGPNGEHLTY